MSPEPRYLRRRRFPQKWKLEQGRASAWETFYHFPPVLERDSIGEIYEAEQSPEFLTVRVMFGLNGSSQSTVLRTASRVLRVRFPFGDNAIQGFADLWGDKHFRGKLLVRDLPLPLPKRMLSTRW
jgi:hypothetical protein